VADSIKKNPASFRDPSGFVFQRDGVLYRQINRVYEAHYRQLHASGLYEALCAADLLVPHREVSVNAPEPDTAFAVIQPEVIPFVSYPYEWPFSALKAAALATLEIQKIALAHGMSLKDASAYNIQFLNAKPIFIDTLSFEPYREGEAWVAYRQFCGHFLAPLALMAHRDARLGLCLRDYIDGIPVDLASALLPRRTWFRFGLAIHLHLHGRAQRQALRDEQAGKTKSSKGGGLSKMGMLGVIDSLRGTIEALRWNPEGTVWADYYEATNYTPEAMGAKEELVAGFLQAVQPKTVWDLGANTGRFSCIAAGQGAHTVAFDFDAAAVEKNFRACVEKGVSDVLPLVLDLTNPSPALGWAHGERSALIERGPVDAVLALALVHHLAIVNNVPLPMLADFFADLTESLIIEFVPKSDSQVQRLLAAREDIFEDYTKAGFEAAFGARFALKRVEAISGAERHLYLMRRRR
jgi:hypothetical protein